MSEEDNEEYLEMIVKYQIKNGFFKITGNLNREGQISLISNHIRDQMGKGADNSKPIKADEYRIRLRWFPSDDLISCRYNTGNKGLREGILGDVLNKLVLPEGLRAVNMRGLDVCEIAERVQDLFGKGTCKPVYIWEKTMGDGYHLGHVEPFPSNRGGTGYIFNPDNGHGKKEQKRLLYKNLEELAVVR